MPDVREILNQIQSRMAGKKVHKRTISVEKLAITR